MPAHEESVRHDATERGELDAPCAHHFKLLVPEDDGASRTGRAFRSSLALHILARLLRGTGRIVRREIARRAAVSPAPPEASTPIRPMRLFVGIPLPPPIVNELSALAKPLGSHFDGLRWTTPASWHVTLQFLGNTSQEVYECVVARLREIQSPAVRLRLEGFDSFWRAGVFFARVVVTPGLETLQRRVTAATKPCGFVPEARPYQPHITLARSKRGSSTKDLWSLADRVSRTRFAPELAAREFALYESLLGRQGSRYEIREHFPLSAN